MGAKIEPATFVQLEAAGLEAFRLAAGGALLSPTQPTPRDKENCDPERNPEKPQNDFSLGICWRIWAHFFLTPARNSFSGLTNERDFTVPMARRHFSPFEAYSTSVTTPAALKERINVLL